MSSRSHNQDGMQESLKKQLALAVRSIQWSYAIIWSISPTQSGVLEWADGYYNGDIKTRKTVQSVEIDADQLGLQRSEQLRELYESLSAGETNPQARRPTVALSPEDLSETEWYYLVCMSFVFNIGRGLPGRTLAKGEPIWLSNAHYANSKVFSRSLLAKSASIKTVVCFPFSDGVVELGVTELVSEDPSLIQHIRTTFLDIPYPMSQKLNLRAVNMGDEDLAFAEIDHDILDTKMIPSVGCEELDLDSPGSCSKGNEFDNQNAEDLLMVEEQTVEASQVHSWQLMDDDFSTCVFQPMNSSDCISQTLVNPATLVCLPDNEKLKEPVQQVQDCNRPKVTALDLQTDVFHYQNVLSALLKTSHSLVLGPNVRNPHQGSSFVSWTKGGPTNCAKSKGETQQRLLKKILFDVPRMHTSDLLLLESPEYDGDKKGIWTPEAGDISMNHILAERRKRGKLNERFTVLRSIIPSISKVDKISILDDTIEYLQELERRVEELESSSREVAETEARTKWKAQEPSERTSGNYGNTIKAVLNKRKACDVDETEQDMNCVGSYADNLIVSVSDKDVLIKMRCPWREGMLLDIMDAITNLHLDTHSVQSSTVDGMLSVTIKSQNKRSTFASARMIKKELQRVASKY
ncbi:transcription factor EGL1 [Tripterygium wilfordii]|uniref:Transcription factor EGL1 n=1 Tax=Tripterygium wilfordii TaxID=458696 RepID=A0A7J7C7B4_TRIWF|nr:transcription factor GLABRA 3-like [Tripterygium wilfordii]KAF5730002.1 transcription factor EGL1 [Tripterygium wilfordii]